MNTRPARRGGSETRPYYTHSWEALRQRQFGDFRCAACGGFVTSQPELSGVQNRNHCPYCLASRHVDLNQAGDRLSACKAIMQPLGLALKRVHKKYASPVSGELLIHRCTDCGKLSLNRLAADDDADTLLRVFEASLDAHIQALVTGQQVAPLGPADRTLVRKRLLGWN